MPDPTGRLLAMPRPFHGGTMGCGMFGAKPGSDVTEPWGHLSGFAVPRDPAIAPLLDALAHGILLLY